MKVYGTDALAIQKQIDSEPQLAAPIAPPLPYVAAEVVWAVREEMARTLDDVLARRTRALFLNARAALASAPSVVTLLARELDRGQNWIDSQLASFRKIAAHYTLPEQESKVRM